jgi:hypothetical protein
MMVALLVMVTAMPVPMMAMLVAVTVSAAIDVMRRMDVAGGQQSSDTHDQTQPQRHFP